MQLQMLIIDLPNELLDQISQYLPFRDWYYFVTQCKDLYYLQFTRMTALKYLHQVYQRTKDYQWAAVGALELGWEAFCLYLLPHFPYHQRIAKVAIQQNNLFMLQACGEHLREEELMIEAVCQGRKSILNYLLNITKDLSIMKFDEKELRRLGKEGDFELLKLRLTTHINTRKHKEEIMRGAIKKRRREIVEHLLPYASNEMLIVTAKVEILTYFEC